MEKTAEPPQIRMQRRTLIDGFQKIDFSRPDGDDSSEIYSTEVAVIPRSGSHDSGSSKVKLHNFVDYTWEERFYTGKLLAVHMDGVYIAYGIKALNKSAGVVRVVDRQSDQRTLIKGMEGAVQDIAFAHIPQEIILACVDLKGNLFVYKIVKELPPCPPLVCELLLHVLPDPSYIPEPCDFYRVVWCPFIPDIPDPGEDPRTVEIDPNVIDEAATLLALSRGTKVELWCVKMVTRLHGPGPVSPGLVEGGFIELNEHKKPIVDAAFSPDGTAIATASMDGEVKFFQVYMQNMIPRCLHQWQPHGGAPLSSLFFLENHRDYDSKTRFWKFTVTGANNNSELKIWSCESWACLQTLQFHVSPERPIKLNAGLDLASGYLLLSDFHHKILYVLEIFSDNDNMSAGFVSISEFLLPYPILSFGIVDAGVKYFKSKNLEELSDMKDEESVPAVLIRMFLVQPKSLQDCQIAFIPPKEGSVDRSEMVPCDQITTQMMFRDALAELSVNVSNGDITSSNSNLHDLPPANHTAHQFNLMTPDAFNSPVKQDLSGSSLIKGLTEETSYSNTTTLVASPHSPEETDNNLLTGVVETAAVFGFASGGSSPSREVQEILGEGKCFFQESNDLQPDEQIKLSPPEEKSATVWPEIPMLRATEVRKNEEQARRSVIQGESCASGDGSDLWKLNQRVETSITSMIHIMNSLLQAFEEQAAEVKLLREEIHQQNLLREIDKIISHSTHQQTQVIESILASKDNKQQQDAIAASVSHSITNFLSTKFFDSVANEISATVTPAVHNQMESLKHQVHVELTQKLSTTDHLLKENITKLVHSRSVMDVLSAAVISSLTPAISQCYKEYFTSIALPSFEKSCSTMFNQINETFSKGSKEFVSSIDLQSRRLTEKNREQNIHLQTALSDVLKNSTSQMSTDVKKTLGNIEKNVLEAVTSALSIQQATLEGSVMAAVRSTAVTPAPHVIDTQLQQTQILQLISQGHVNAAFQQALSASDLSLVVFICEKVNPQQLFCQVPCPLQQHVLLSLVQQLSADMNNNTEIKYKYLEEALMNLDVQNSVTREHLPTILGNLQRQLQMYISSNPNNRITRSMKLILMASQALLNSCTTNSR